MSFLPKLVCCFLLAFSSAVPARAHTATEWQQHLKLSNFVNNPLKLPEQPTLSQLRHFGKVLNVTQRVIPNEYEPLRQNSYYDFHYPGLMIEALYLQTTPNTGGMIHLIEVSNVRWRLADGIRVGMAENQVRQILGMPNKQTKRSLEYDGQDSSATFWLSHGRVQKVEFDYSIN